MKTIASILFPIAVVSLIILLCAGCSTSVRDNVPVTKFTAMLGGKPCSFAGPKDFKASLVEFQMDTNGSVRLTLKDIDARMNPDVISMTGEAYTKMMTANSQMARDSVGLAKELAPIAAAALTK